MCVCVCVSVSCGVMCVYVCVMCVMCVMCVSVCVSVCVYVCVCRVVCVVCDAQLGQGVCTHANVIVSCPHNFRARARACVRWYVCVCARVCSTHLAQTLCPQTPCSLHRAQDKVCNKQGKKFSKMVSSCAKQGYYNVSPSGSELLDT